MKPSEILLSEYNPYYKNYIDLVGNINLMDALVKGSETIQTFFGSLPENKWGYQYAAGKWTPRDVSLHIADTERVFAYRALYFARNSDVELKGFDDKVFAENAEANDKTVEALLQNYVAVRNASLTLFSSFNVNQLKQIGVANGNAMSVRAAGFMICGHEIHHCNIIKERYL